jgi:hypothetical protein
MVSLFRLRSDVAELDKQDLRPLTRARRLIAAARKARKGSLVLARLGIDLFAQGDRIGAVRCLRASRRLTRFDEEVRRRARAELAKRA